MSDLILETVCEVSRGCARGLSAHQSPLSRPVAPLRASKVVLCWVEIPSCSPACLLHKQSLRAASEEGRALYSFNVADYYQLHTRFLTQGIAHGGIILAQQQRFGVGEQMRRLLNLIAKRTAEEMQNHVEFLSAWG